MAAPPPRLIKVVNITTRTSHHERSTMSGAGYIRNGGPAPAARSARGASAPPGARPSTAGRSGPAFAVFQPVFYY
jgi:hypothetical protein